MSFYRSLSPLEASFIASNQPGYSPFVNQFIVEGKGELVLEDWQAAVELATKANVTARTQLKGFWGWRHWDDEGAMPLVRHVITGWDGLSAKNAPDIFSSIDPIKGPNAEVILIESEKEGSDKHSPKVLFRAHHGITDGKGMLHWMEECFRALRGEALLGSPGTTNEWDIVTSNEPAKRNIKEGNCIPLTLPSSTPNTPKCHWVRCQWPGKHTKITPKLMLAASVLAKKNNRDAKHGASNAVSNAVSNDSHNGRVLFRIPSDLRRYLGKNAPFSMANTTGALDLEVFDDSTPQSIQSAIIKGMRNHLDLAVFPKSMFLVNWLPKMLFTTSPAVLANRHRKGTYRMTGSISYLGEVNLNALQYDRFQSTALYGVPMPLENRSIFIGASSTKEMLTLTLGIPRALAAHDELIIIGEQLHEIFVSL